MSEAAGKDGPSVPGAGTEATAQGPDSTQNVTKKEIPEGFKTLKEGKATILKKGNEVFYNEAQVTNRDISIGALRVYLRLRDSELESGTLKKRKGNVEKGPRLLEGLAATGLRSIRYAMEVPQLGRIDANDMDKDAVAAITRNVEFNGGEAASKIRVLRGDARMTMLQSFKSYEVVDLDPYGTPANLLDSAVQAVSDGGLLMVTATDMANLCGNNPTACWANYGIYPVHRSYCHEMALRIVLACIETHAARYKRYIVPLLSLSMDFYVRIFVRIYSGPNEVKESPARLSYLWQSSGCDSFVLQPVGQKRQNGDQSKYMPGSGPAVESRCPDTGSGYLMGGPIWSAPIHDMDFAKALLKEIEDGGTAQYAQAVKIRGYLLSVCQELPDAPLYYNLHDITKAVRITPPKADQFRSALVHAGYRVSGSHANPLAIKTDAPPSVVWDILRCWVRLQGGSKFASQDPASYSAKLLAKEPAFEANFQILAKAMARKKGDTAPRFVQNPAYWGPKARHGRPDQTRPQSQQEQQQGGGDAAGKGAAARGAARSRGKRGGGARAGAGGGDAPAGAADEALTVEMAEVAAGQEVTSDVEERGQDEPAENGRQKRPAEGCEQEEREAKLPKAE